MKKILFYSALGVTSLSLAFGACKKSDPKGTYTCSCTSTNSGGGSPQTATFTINDTKSNATNQCNASSGTVTSGGFTLTTTCTLQ